MTTLSHPTSNGAPFGGISPTRWPDRSRSPEHRSFEAAHAAREPISMPTALLREGMRVLCCDGVAGRVLRVVRDEQRGTPLHLVVQCGTFRPQRVRVAMLWVAAITPDQVELALHRRDLLGLTPYRHDYEIAEEIERMLHGERSLHNYPDLFAVKATVQDGVVRLQGNVCNDQRRHDAEQIVRSVRGVVGVRNALHTDDQIDTVTTWLIQHDGRIHVRDLRVETCLGLVRLSGTVASLEQRALATTLVQQVAGVHAVNNALVVDVALDRFAVPLPLVGAQPQPAPAVV